MRHMNTLHLASKHITGELHAIVKSLLGKATREDMISWLANTLNGNKERAKMQEDLKVSGVPCVLQCSLTLVAFASALVRWQ